MRIGIDARMYGPAATTGIGNYIKNLTRELFLIDQKNEYFLFMLEPEFSKFQAPNSRIKKIMVTSKWYSWSEQFKLVKIYNRFKLDLLHIPHFNVPIFYSGKMVTTIHDITPKFFPGPIVRKSLIRKLGYHLVFNAALRKSKVIITNSYHTRNEITNYFGVDEKKIRVIYLGHDNHPTNPKNQESITEVKNKYGITKPFLLYIGVWRDHKNLPNLVAAFNRLREKFNLDLQLVLAGTPNPNYPEIFQAINNSPFKRDIIKPGYVPDQELPAFYCAAKLFVLPSFCEGFGLVVLESAAYGTPVVASKTTSVPEILGNAARYFDPADPDEMANVISQVITDKDLYQNLKIQGQRQSQKYHWQKCAKQTLEVYQNS